MDAQVPVATLTPKQALAQLQLRDVESLCDKLASGEIPGGFKVGNVWRIKRAVFEAWLSGDEAHR